MLRAGLLVVGLVLLASPALAQARRLPAPATGPRAVPVRLDYSLGPGAEVCPDEQGFRDAVAENVGHDLFTPTARRAALVKIQRKGARFIAFMELRDAAGEQEWEHNPPLSRSDCRTLVHVMGLSIAITIDPFPAARRASPRAEPAPVVPPPPQVQPAPAKPLAESVAPAPVEVPNPRVFDGRAGFGLALLIGLTAGELGTGITFEAVAASRGDEARRALGALQQKAGSLPCNGSSPASAGTCQQIAELRQQHDHYTDLGVGSFVAASVTAATASIWILRTPTAPSVQVTPSAPGSLTGLTLHGLW